MARQKSHAEWQVAVRRHGVRGKPCIFYLTSEYGGVLIDLYKSGVIIQRYIWRLRA